MDLTNLYCTSAPKDKAEEELTVATHLNETPMTASTLHFNKNIPMQMLAVMGVSFKCVATVNSSSALSFGADVNIDWWGEQMDEELIRDEGFLTLKEAKQVLFH